MEQSELAREIYRKFYRRLKRYISQQIDDENDVEEILQESISAAIYSFPFFLRKSSLFTWLCGIARHEIADFYRKKKIKTILFSRLPFLENLVDQALGPEEAMIEAELKRRVKIILRGLGEGYQLILRLKYIDGHSVVQIAKKLGLTYQATESRLSRARLAFREAWINENGKFQITKENFF